MTSSAVKKRQLERKMYRLLEAIQEVESEAQENRRWEREMARLLDAIRDVGINKRELARLVGYKGDTINGVICAQGELPRRRVTKIASILRDRWQTIDGLTLTSATKLTDITRPLLISQSHLAQELGVSKQLLNRYIPEHRIKDVERALNQKKNKILKATEFLNDGG